MRAHDSWTIGGHWEMTYQNTLGFQENAKIPAVHG